MKKTINTILTIVAGALLFSACVKEDFTNGNGASLVTLSAYQEGEDATKTAIDGTDSKKIDWSTGDKINYFGDATGQFMTLKTGAGTTSGTFEGTVTPGTTGSPDCVLYPYQSAAKCASGIITAEVPMTQYAVAKSFDPAAALMVGVVNGEDVEFKNVMSYVKVTIPSDMTNCKQVAIKAKDAWTTVAGKVNITAADATWAETTAKEGQAFVRLVPKAPATKLEAGTAYYIAILPQTMSTGFEFIFNDDDVIKVKQSASTEVVFGRRKVKPIGAITSYTYEVGTINLTPTTTSTLKLADRNIGAATSSDYGDYFAWAALRPVYITHTQGANLTDATNYKQGGFTQANYPYYDGAAYTKYTSTDKLSKIEPCDDIAAMLWGGNWRMPANKELYSNSKVDGTLPLSSKMTKSERYLGDEITSKNCGYFWEADIESNYTKAYFVLPHSASQDISYDRYYGLTVRPVLAKVTDLSASECANCYIVSGAGDYKFKAVNKGNSPNREVGTVNSVVVVWESFGTNEDISDEDLIKNVKYSDGYITFAATNKKGNALIAAKDASKNILWSWHIWLTDAPADQDYYGGATLLDRNLGATSANPGDVKSFGLFYQWGRKDPFLCTDGPTSTTAALSTGAWNSVDKSSITVTKDYVIQNPTTFIYSKNDNEWLSSNDNTLWKSASKTYTDPCPPGYRVPSGDTFKNAYADKKGDYSFDDTNAGINFHSVFGDAETIWYPAAGLRNRNDGNYNTVGSEIHVWTAEYGSKTNTCSKALLYKTVDGVTTFDTQAETKRPWGMNVRCMKIK